MKVNLIVGGLNIFCWLVWFLFHWSAGPHVRCHSIFQCSGSASVCFWTSWIHIRICNLIVRSRIRILPSTSKKIKKSLDFYCFVTSFWLFILEEWWKMNLRKGISTKNYFLFASWRSLTKRAGSGSGSAFASGSVRYQNVTDPEHCYFC